MQPRVARNAIPQPSTGPVQDPAAKAALDDAQRQIAELRRELDLIKRQAQTGGATVSREDVTSLKADGGKLRVFKRRTIYPERGLPQVSEEIPAGSIDGLGGGGGDVYNINNEITNVTNTTEFTGEYIIYTGFTAE